MKGIKWGTIVFLLFILSGCGGDSKNASSNTSSPSISNLVFTPNFTGECFVRFDFADSDGDVATATAVLYDAKGISVGSQTTQLIDIAGATSGTIGCSFNFSSLSPGDYSAGIYVTDSTGLQSNNFNREFKATASFANAVGYPPPKNNLYNMYLGDTAIGDLNGDGRNDVVVIGTDYKSRLLFYYQNASGKLESPLVMDLGIDIRGVVIADVNNDDKADLVLSGRPTDAFWSQPGVLLVILQDPATGQLLPQHEYALSLSDGLSMAVADLNGDGRNDIVVGSGNLSIFFQNTAGTLDPPVVYDNVNAGIIHIADMDNDERNDIVVTSGPKEFAVIRQTAPGIFSSTPERYTTQTSYWPNSGPFALGDVNGDGRTDVVVLDPGNSGYLNIFMQNSQGKLDPPIFLPIDTSFGVRIADVTGDGLNDIIYDVSGAIMVFPQQPDHTFGPRYAYGYYHESFGGSFVTQALSIGDVTGDGQPDAVVTWSDEGLYVFPYCALLEPK